MHKTLAELNMKITMFSHSETETESEFTFIFRGKLIPIL